MKIYQLLFMLLIVTSQLTFSGPVLDQKLKFGTGIFLFEDKSEYAPKYATNKIELNVVETNKAIEVFSGKDPIADKGSGTKYELRVYRPGYPNSKKISRWIEAESGRDGWERFKSAHYKTNGELDSYTDCRWQGDCSVLDSNICKKIVAGMDEALAKANVTFKEMEACESKGLSIYLKLQDVNKSIKEDKSYQEKAVGVINTLNAELPKLNKSFDVNEKKLVFKQYEDNIPNFFSRHISDYLECKSLMTYFEKVTNSQERSIRAAK